MLSYLRVRGLALLSDVELNFVPGMNVLTGETGAGKSILVGALSLVRGLRGRAEMVRDGQDMAIVDAQFDPSSTQAPGLLALLQEHGLPFDLSEGVLIHRTLPRTGRGRSFVQGTLTSQAVLEHMGEALIDICSQHEHHFLTHTPRHLDVLDAYAEVDADLAAYDTMYGAFRETQARHKDLQTRVRDGAKRADYLRFQIEEIERVAPVAGEYEALKGRLALMRASHQWAAFAQEAQAVLYENDDAIAARLAALCERAKNGAADSLVLASMQEQLAAAQIACEEAAAFAQRLGTDLELDPAEYEASEERLHELETLRRKHGMDLDALAQQVEAMREELDEIEHAEGHLEALQVRMRELQAHCEAQAATLRTRRKAKAEHLARAVEHELAALHMEGARIEVAFAELSELGPRGGDRVEFLFTANPGEPLAPLAKVASGGELSRVLLAIKGVLAGGDRVATYVFDEVDAGVGGAVAEAIGQRLARASKAHQVLCITHLPQIAAFANAHFKVEKAQVDGRTLTQVKRLSPAERVEEIARMLGGKRISKSAREHAAELLAGAR